MMGQWASVREAGQYGKDGNDMIIGTLLAKGVADFTFGGAFLWYLVKFIVSAIVAFCAILLGIKLRKSKNAKLTSVQTEAGEETQKSEA